MKERASKRKREQLDEEQATILEEAFESNTHPSKKERERLAKQTGLPFQKITKWFDNKRTRVRNMDVDNDEERSSKRKRKVPPKEPWMSEEDKIHSLKPAGYISGRKHTELVVQNLPDWLKFMKLKKNKNNKSILKEAREKFQTEIHRLLDSITFEAETIMYQGDGVSMDANVSICNWCFSIGDKEDGNSGPSPQKGDITVVALHDSRVIGTDDSQVSFEKYKLKFFKFGHSGEKLSLGVKANGTTQSLVDGEDLDSFAWGDLPKLKRWLNTSLTDSELVSFLFFCTQWRLHVKWVIDCVRTKMLPGEDSDYFSESDEYDLQDLHGSDSDSE